MKKELALYLIIFMIEGHTTWRAAVHGSKDGLEMVSKNNPGQKLPKLTAKKVYRIDRITGTIEECL